MKLKLSNNNALLIGQDWSRCKSTHTLKPLHPSTAAWLQLHATIIKVMNNKTRIIYKDRNR